MEDIRQKYQKEKGPNKILIFLKKNKWKILLFTSIILIFVFPTFTAKIIGTWFNDFFSTLFKYAKF
ncbi:hypothetical protein M0Q50_04790 [bacterium]|jgi:hypothetical protein|nr:hypothetical protein [bacterium]